MLDERPALQPHRWQPVLHRPPGRGALLFSYASPDTILHTLPPSLLACSYATDLLFSNWVSLFIDRIRACVLLIYVFGISHSLFSDFSRCFRSFVIEFIIPFIWNFIIDWYQSKFSSFWYICFIILFSFFLNLLNTLL